MNRTKQKAIIKKLYSELHQRNEFRGYHDYGTDLIGFVSPFRVFFTSETYDEPKAKELLNWEKYCSRENKTYAKADVFDTDTLKASAKGFHWGDNPFLLYCMERKYGINPKFLKDAMDWCGKDFYVEVDMDNANSPIWCFGRDGKAMILPIRVIQ